MSSLDRPAYPVSTKDGEDGHQSGPSEWQFPGLSKLEHACIALKVPNSGNRRAAPARILGECGVSMMRRRTAKMAHRGRGMFGLTFTQP